MFVGRKKELDALNNRYKSNRKEFGVLYGRRRIGKSSILNEFLKGKKGILFQAKQDNSYGNLKSFSYEVNHLLNLPDTFVFASWQHAFKSIQEYAKNERFVLIIDEYPYIVSQDSSFSSVLQEFIDHASDNMMVILSGSDIGFLQKEIQNHASPLSSPLYKRRTFEMEIKKMNFMDAKEFVKMEDVESQTNYLCLMSGYPYYLSTIDHTKTFYENIQYLLFNEFGTFFYLPDQLLSNSTNVQDVYNSILVSISKRNRTIKTISEDIHEAEAKVSKYISTLIKSEIVEKKNMYNGNKRTVYYDISDSMLKLWYTLIFENQEKIKINGNLVFERNKEKLDSFLSFEFENLSILYMDMLNEKGELEDIFPHIQNYKVDNSKLGRSIEIDGITSTKEYLLVMDCKYRNKKYTKDMYEHLKESASIFPDKLKRVYYIFSKEGFNENMIEDKNIHLFDLKKMFE